MPVVIRNHNSNEKSEEESPSTCSVAYLEARHCETIEGERRPPETWRMKERMKTVSVALTLCLNIGVDPPDIAKPQPCARLECWLDPMAMSQQKALEMIGAALQKQYERWQPRARYKLSLDPTVEDVKKLCMSLRRNAKDERVLFHYNGHGVPKPTKNGEIWVFNERYTQYIPLSIYDLQTWMGTPSIFVWDCNCAGLVVESFRQFAEQHEREILAAAEYQQQKATQNGATTSQSTRKVSNDIVVPDSHEKAHSEEVTTAAATSTSTPTGPAPVQVPNFRDCIQLGACQMDQILPTNPELPSDLFTSCLTTPIKVAVLWYILQNNLTEKLPLDVIDKIPGQLSDRRTLLGELNWILTAITDTIAWNTLPRELFQTLFRQDLLVASLFRNFLLADRVMRSYHCTPVSHPELPSTAEHPMWQAWDSVLDVCLSQLPLYIGRPDAPAQVLQPVPSIPLSHSSGSLSEIGGCEYTHSLFFANQLTAFEVWLEYGYDHRGPPQQLPIVLQVLLSQVHRVRALELLGRFLDLGPWAVSLALSVGIFPYVLKLLQSFAKELRPLLSFIWAKILAVDPECQGDLIKDGGHRYFLQILSDPSVSCEQKIVPAFVLAAILDDYAPGQEAIMQGGYMSICMELFNDCRSSLLRQWLAIGLGRLWSNFDAARWQGIRCVAYEKLFELLDDPTPEVRASAVFGLGTLISNRSDQNEHAVHTDHSITMKLVAKVRGDASPLVRKELTVALQWVVLNFEYQFVMIAYELCEEQVRIFEERQRQLHMMDKAYAKQRLQTNGSVAHFRQSSLNVPDDVDISTSGGDHRRQNSMHNLAASPTTCPSPAPTMSPAASFSKLLGLGNVLTTSSSLLTPRTSIAVEPSRDPVSVLENRLRNLVRSAGTQSNVYATVWKTMLTLATDPYPEVASLAEKIINHVNTEAQQLRRAKSESEDAVSDLRQHHLQMHAVRRSIQVGIGKGTGQSPTTSSSTPHCADTALDTVDCARSVLSELQRPTFVVGSPSDVVHAGSPAAVSSHNPDHVITGQFAQRVPHSKSITSLNEPPPMPLYSTIYTCPKRVVFGTGPFEDKEPDSPAPRRTGRKAPLIKTEFVAWCSKRFTSPVLHLLNDETAGEEPKPRVEVPLTDWAVESMEAIRHKAQKDWRLLSPPSKGTNGSAALRLDLQTFVNKNPRPPCCMQFFHLYPLLCIGEPHDVSLWNWRSGQYLGAFPNSTPGRGGSGRISTLQVVNPLTHGYLMTGTETGEVRIFDCNIALDSTGVSADHKSSPGLGVSMSSAFLSSTMNENCLETSKPSLVTAWSPALDVNRFGVRPRTEYFWEQDAALLFVGGDFKTLRVWDARREQKVQEFAIGTDHRTVTSISADYYGHSLVAVGTVDGDVRVYDHRVPPDENRIMKLRDLTKPVVKVHLQRKSIGSQLVAASEDGQIRVWDPRMFQDPVVSCQLDDHHQQSNSPAQVPFQYDEFRVSAMDVHEEYEVMALSTVDTHTVYVVHLNGKELNTIRYHDGYMGQKLGDIRCLQFHPHLLTLGLGGGDNVVATYGVSP